MIKIGLCASAVDTESANRQLLHVEPRNARLPTAAAPLTDCRPEVWKLGAISPSVDQRPCLSLPGVTLQLSSACRVAVTTVVVRLWCINDATLRVQLFCLSRRE